MALQVVNQQLSEILPIYSDDLSKPFDADLASACLKDILKPVWTPLSPKYPVEIIDDKNNQYDEDKLVERLMDCFGEQRNPDAEDDINSMWKGALAFFKTGLTANEVFTAQAFAKKKYPAQYLPSPTVIYTPNDLKNACKEYLAQGKQDDSAIIVNASFYFNEPCLMFHFLTKNTFNEFKDYVKQAVSILNNTLTAETVAKFADFNQMNLNTIEGLILRKNDGDESDEYSFARVLVKAAIDFAQVNDDCGIIAP